MLLVCYSYVSECYSYVTRMYSYVTRTLLVVPVCSFSHDPQAQVLGFLRKMRWGREKGENF